MNITWGEFKKQVEDHGALDSDIVRAIQVPFGMGQIVVRRDQVWPENVTILGDPAQVPMEIIVKEYF